MATNTSKILLVIFYLIIIICIPLLLGLLLKYTVCDTRIKNIKQLAYQKALETKKPLIIFNTRYHGTVIELSQESKRVETNKFDGDLVEIVDHLADNSSVMLISGIFEYMQDNTELQKLIYNLKKVTGGDLYVINVGSHSPQIIFDYKLKNIMTKPFYLPDRINVKGNIIESSKNNNNNNNNTISWTHPNNLQLKLQNIYSYVFKILPYNFFVSHKINDFNDC